MVWLPDGENFLKICLVVLTEYTNVTDTRTDRLTDGQTPHDDIYSRACIASRGKNRQKLLRPRRKSRGFTHWRCPSVCLSVCLLVCRLSVSWNQRCCWRACGPPYHGCPGCFSPPLKNFTAMKFILVALACAVVRCLVSVTFVYCVETAVTTKCEQESIPKLSHDTVFNDLEWFWVT